MGSSPEGPKNDRLLNGSLKPTLAQPQRKLTKSRTADLDA